MVDSALNEKDAFTREKLWLELGSTIQGALEDDSVVEVMRNPDGQIWIERHDTGMSVEGEMTDPNAQRLIRTVAHSLHQVATRETPIVEGHLVVDGSRFEGFVEPVVRSAAFIIRKRSSRVIALKEYVAAGILNESQADILTESIRNRKNLLISGGTGTGKTTFMNSLIREIAVNCPNDRVIIMEDTPEIQCESKNHLTLQTSYDVPMRRLLHASLRSRPDRILVGEVRGPEALDLLKSWETGHPGGIGTVHGSSVPSALLRMSQLVREAGTEHFGREIVSQTVDMVAVLEGKGKHRHLKSLAEVEPPPTDVHWNYEEK